VSSAKTALWEISTISATETIRLIKSLDAMALSHRALILSIVLAGLCGAVQGQQVKKSITATAVQNDVQKVFNILFTDTADSYSRLGGTIVAAYGQLGTYTQTGGIFEGLATTGLVLSSGNVASVQEGGTPSTAYNTGISLRSLDALLPNHKTTDAAVAEIEFTAEKATTVSLSFVFASEEYNAGNPDVFGLWVNDVNVALIGGQGTRCYTRFGGVLESHATGHSACPHSCPTSTPCEVGYCRCI
jgi:hypothetical protein